jgi:hypothetical protein
MTWKEIVVSQLVQYLLPPLMMAMLGMFGYAIVWLRSRISVVKKEFARGVGLRLMDAVQIGVKATQQQTVDALIAASADGKITPEEAHKIKEEALERSLRYLGENGIKEAKRVFKPEELEAKLRESIEALVHDLKIGKPKVLTGVLGETATTVRTVPPPPSSGVPSVMVVPEKDGGL